MSSNESIQILQEAPRRASAACQPLLDAATPDLFRNNAFRITGLAVDATPREIAKHADRLKMREELGRGDEVHKFAFALKPPPTVDQIREAMHRLKDPERRMVDELFWFWPERGGEGAPDPAMQALAHGDYEGAMRIWAAREKNPSDGVLATHNMAIAWHLAALDMERQPAHAPATGGERWEAGQFWRNAFQRWERLADDDRFWALLTERARQLDDPRLTTGFIRRMRTTLPEALDKVNAELALRHAETGNLGMARRHIEFMRETNQGLDNVERTAELVLGPATTRLNQQIQRARERAEKDPADGVNAARDLLAHAQHSLPLFDLFFGKDSELRNSLSDEVAKVCNQLPVAYQKATGEDHPCLEILKAALPFAASPELRDQIQKNIDTLSGNLAFNNLEPVFAQLKEIQEGKERPHLLLDRFNRELVPVLDRFLAVATNSEMHQRLFDAAAIVLRGISLAAWNSYPDHRAAVSANELARKYARSPELRARLKEDQTALGQIPPHMAAARAPVPSVTRGRATPPRNATTQVTATPSQEFSIAKWVVIGSVMALFIAGVYFGTEEPLSSRPVRSVPTDPLSSAATSRASEVGDRPEVYRVTPSMSAELDRDRDAIAAAKAEAASLTQRLDDLSREIDRERLFLDETSQFAVDAFNRKVDRYNSVLEDVRSRNGRVNQMVDAYNDKLRRYGR